MLKFFLGIDQHATGFDDTLDALLQRAAKPRR
jgi:hypothetical protein